MEQLTVQNRLNINTKLGSKYLQEANTTNLFC